MNSFLCRVMTLVFLFNCLTPATGWGQTSRRANSKKSSLEKQVTAKVKNAQQANTPAAQFARADKETRDAHNARFAQADSIAKANSPDPRQAWQEMVARESTQHLIQQPSSLYVAPRISSERAPVENQSRAKNFLQNVMENKISFEQLIDYVDPMNPDPAANDLLTIAYAAEVISNTVGEAMQLDSTQYDLNEFQAQLVQLQARLLYRLALLGFEMPSYTANPAKDPVSVAHASLEEALNAPSTRKTMAVAGLRMALFKIHQFYQAKNLPDPADEYQKEMLVQQAVKPLTRPNPRVNDGLVTGPANNAQQQAAARKQAAQTVKNHGNLAVFMDQFIREFKESIDNEPEQGSAAYQYVQVRAEYATAYALEYDPAYLKKIDKGPKETDFKQDYSPILNAIFVTVFENTRYSAMGDAKTKQVLNLLREFSDPQKYSLPTRVFALEAASLLYRPFNQVAFNTKQPGFAFFAPINFNQPDETLRRVFAQRVADLYCPLVSTNSYAMKDYGLSSEEMEALANKLGYMYDGFYDINTQFFEDADAPASQKVRANYPHTACYITTHGNLNTLKRDNEQTSAFLWFSVEVLLWAYGGDLFSLLGTAFRLTRGAVAALPKAGRAFTVAARGEKVAAFNAQLQEGAKFANWVYKNKKQQGYIVEAIVQKAPVRVEKEVVVENGVAKTVERIIEPVNEYKPITTTHQLEGKYSLWNPKRWVGMKPGDKVLGYRVTHMQPGFETTVGEMRFEKLVNGHFVVEPVDGLHSLQDITQMTRRLQTADGSRFWFEQQPYWRGALNMAQAQQEQWTLSGLQSAFKNQMDMWIPLEKAAQQTGKISETTRWWNVTQWGAPKEWGELAAGKMWGEAVKEGGTSALMPIYVAPKTSFRTISQVALGQPGLTNVPGVANVADVLPGFYTTGADLATGNVYSQMFHAYMKPLNWQKTWAKTLLPDYIPTKAFWQSMKINPVLGAQLAPQLLWRNRFGITTALFAAYAGADRLIYPPFKSWMEGQATKDANEEIAKYGDTFSPDQAKMDELLLQEMGVDLSDKRAMTAYNDVLAAQPDQVDGTLFSAPIIGARRAMGMPFIGDDVKADYEHQAVRTDLNRALLHRNYNRFKEGQQATAQWQQEQRAAIHEDEQKVLSLYAQGFAALPQVKQQLHKVYQNYAKEFLAAQTQEEATQASERFNAQIGGLITQAAEWDNALKTAESLIAQAKKEYADMPRLITPEVEKYIRQNLRTYAAERCAALQTANPQAAAQQADKKLEQALQVLWYGLSVQYQMEHPAPAEQGGYGPHFDPNAAD